jgi:hypothetical protein
MSDEKESPEAFGTRLALKDLERMQREHDTELVRIVYEWRLSKGHDKDVQAIEQMVARLLNHYHRPIMTEIVWSLADEKTILAAADARVLVGGEYFYYHPGRTYVEALAAEALERNPDKIRCRFCWKDKCDGNCIYTG